MMANTDTIFEQLSEHERASSTAGGKAAPDDWRPILPAPVAPPDRPRHPSHGVASCHWIYRDASGDVQFLMCRFDQPDGAKKILPLTYGILNGSEGWHWKAAPAPRSLYRLDRLAQRPDAPVLIVEGEKTVDAAETLFPEFVPVTSSNGAGAASKGDWAPLKDRRVVIWPDNDDEGKKYAADVKRLATKAGAISVAVVAVPEEFPAKWDLADAPPKGWSTDNLSLCLYGAKPAIDATNSKSGETGKQLEDPYFRLDQAGVWRAVRKKDSHEVEWHLICSPLEVVAETRDADGKNWGRLLAIRTREGQCHEWAMPMEMLAGDGTAYRSELFYLGLDLAPGRMAREALHEYIATIRPKQRVRCVTRIGWQVHAFVLPDVTIGGNDGERVLLQTARPIDHAFRVAGNLGDWQSQIATHAIGNSRLAFALSAAFAPPLLHLVGAEAGGFHFRGPSSTGKTTALSIAGSVWGGGGVKGYVRQWRTTDNGLEAVAAAHCDALLCLDELSQIEPKAAGAVAYMLANGAGKSRAGRSGEGRPPAEWRTLFLSSGEIGLADKVAEDGRGRKLAAGQQVRVIDIPADAGAGMGMFEALHGFENAVKLSDHLRQKANEYYGTPARAFLSIITCRLEEVVASVRGCCDEFVAEHCPAGADGQVSRVAGRFALVAAAGELATAVGILPWKPGEALRAAGICFKAWLEARGGHGAAEINDGIRQVQRFIEQHGESRFAAWDTFGVGSDRPTINRAGFRRGQGSSGVEYFVLPEVWRAEVCTGFDPGAIARALMERGLLIPDASDGKPQSRHRLPGVNGKTRCYRLSSAILGDEDA